MLDLTMPDVAYTIGLLQTDGTHQGSLDGKGRVSLELAVRDESVLWQIAAILPCYASVGHRTRTTNFGENHETVILRFYDQATRRALASLGVSVGRKTRTIQPPGGPLATADYLRGLLDGDGSVGFTRNGEPFVSIVTASPAVAEFFRQVVQEVCGVTRTARANRREGVFNVMVRNAAAAHLAAWVWHSADVLGLERKRMAAQQVAAWRPPKEKAGRYGVVRKPWTAHDDEIVMSHNQAEATRILGRTASSVSLRKWRLRNAMSRRAAP